MRKRIFYIYLVMVAFWFHPQPIIAYIWITLAAGLFMTMMAVEYNPRLEGWNYGIGLIYTVATFILAIVWIEDIQSREVMEQLLRSLAVINTAIATYIMVRLLVQKRHTI